MQQVQMKAGHAQKLRLRLGIPRQPDPHAQERASNMQPDLLVGKWIDGMCYHSKALLMTHNSNVTVEGIGIGRVISFERVWNHLLYDSFHTVEFLGRYDTRLSAGPPPSTLY